MCDSVRVRDRTPYNEKHGFSSYQLVFGRNPNLPNVMTNQLPALDASTSSEILATDLNALHAAREAFIQSESSEGIRRALRCKIRASEEKYEHGEWVYYQREGQEKRLGPGKVVFKDGKVVFVRHGGVFVRVSPNRLVKSNPDFRRQVSNSSNTRGHEFTLPEQEPSKVDTIVEESLSRTNFHSLPDSPPAARQENLTMPSTEPTSTQIRGRHPV